MPQNLHFLDPHRWFVGESPAWFLIEVIVRAMLIYVLLQVTLRLMGRRVASQMTVSELAVVVTLGAAIGVPMQAPERGLLPAVLILLVAWGFQRGLSLWTFYSRKAEVIASGDVLVLVQDGRIFLDVMKTCAISRERLFAVLRMRGIEHLGQVRRVYAEATGEFSTYEFRQPKPGLSILPTFDDDLRNERRRESDHWACMSCGAVEKSGSQPGSPCPHCQANRWTEAVGGVEGNAE